jgi:colanic acid biosynthesis glycosyl transferase WcaI
MRILVVSQYFWPEVCPLNDLVVELKNKGHEIMVFTGMPNYPEGKFYSGYSFFTPRVENFNGIKIMRVPLLARGRGSKVRLILNYLSFAFFACILAPFYCKGNYDVIFNYQTSPIIASLPAILLKKIKKIPLFLWVQDLWPDSVIALKAISSPFLLRLLTKLVKYVYKNSTYILVQSKGFVEKIFVLTGNKENIQYFPNWVSKSYYPRDIETARNMVTDVPEGFVVMYAGNVGEAQSFDTILAAMRKLQKYNDLRWVIIGEGSKLNWLKEQVEISNITNNVYFLGRKPSELMPYYFALAKVLLVSLKDEPIFGLTIPSKVQAYLACGRPIIAALKGFGAQVIDEAQAGLVVASADSEALVCGIEKMYKMRLEELEIMGRKGRVYYEKNFDSVMLISQLEKWMQDAISNVRGSR